MTFDITLFNTVMKYKSKVDFTTKTVHDDISIHLFAAKVNAKTYWYASVRHYCCSIVGPSRLTFTRNNVKKTPTSLIFKKSFILSFLLS